jgi:hypothetical protein
MRALSGADDGSWRSASSRRGAEMQLGNVRITTPGSSMAVSEASGPRSVPRGMARRLYWRYIDFLTLYKGLPASQIDTLWNVIGTPSTSDELEQCAIDLRTEIAAEAERRGLKPRDIEAELDVRAATAELPSATGVPRPSDGPATVGQDLLGRLGADILGVASSSIG